MARAFATLAVLAIAHVASAQLYTIEDLGLSERYESSLGQGIASDGRVAGYQSAGSTTTATLWNPGSGPQLLGTLGGTTSFGYAVNSSGTVVGQARDVSDNGLAFRWTSGGGMVSLGTLGGTTSSAHAINNDGTIAGTSFLEGGGFQAFSWTSGGGMVGIGPTSSTGLAINSSGQITGSYLDAGQDAVYRYTPGSGNELLGRPDGTVSARGLGIADSGDIVGYFSPSGSTYSAFLYTGGEFTTLNGLFNYDTRARDINSSGQIVGSSWTSMSGEDSQAVLWDATTTAINLNTLIDAALGWNLINAYSINDAGQITGYGEINGEIHAYRLTPVPEPGTIAALGVGAALLLRRRRRK